MEKKLFRWSVGACALSSAVLLGLIVVPEANADGPTVVISNSGSVATATITGLSDMQACAMVSWDGQRFGEIDLDSAQKAELLNGEALLDPVPQFALAESGKATLQMDIPTPGTYVVVAGCNALEDGIEVAFLSKRITVSPSGTGSLSTGSFGS